MSGILQLPINVVIRDPRASDQRFIAATWFRSMTSVGSRDKHRRQTLNAQIDRVLDDKQTRCLVACSATDSDRIFGWILFSSAPIARVLHYAYVRDDERRKGIARRLIQQAWPTSQARLVVTMRGPDTREFMARHSASYVPLEEYLR